MRWQLFTGHYGLEGCCRGSIGQSPNPGAACAPNKVDPIGYLSEPTCGNAAAFALSSAILTWHLGGS
jgi:hypothetical protein